MASRTISVFDTRLLVLTVRSIMYCELVFKFDDWTAGYEILMCCPTTTCELGRMIDDDRRPFNTPFDPGYTYGRNRLLWHRLQCHTGLYYPKVKVSAKLPGIFYISCYEHRLLWPNLPLNAILNDFYCIIYERARVFTRDTR